MGKLTFSFGVDMNNRSLLVLLVVLSFTVVSGCYREKKPAGFPKIYPCSIVLTQKDKPCADAMITLMSKNKEYERWSIAGTSDNKGVAIITTEGKFIGAPVGEYKVVVMKQETERKEIKNAGNEKEFIIGKSWSYVPLDYSDPEKTTLSATVVKGKNEIKIDLGEAVKIKMESY